MMATSSISATEIKIERTSDQPNWLELPKDVTSNILQRLGSVEIITSACQVCPLWWNICKDPSMWRTIHITNINYYPDDVRYGDKFVKICRNAVARSCGQLEDIAFKLYATDDLLAFIADCSGHLRCMRLVQCERLSEKVFRDVIKKLTFLEELDVSYNHQLSKETFELIGQCCPLLKSLKCGRLVEEQKQINDEAFAIAKTMPKLLHLKISGNVLSNNGVLAILDGCPLLESLDLTMCLYVYLSDSLEKRGLEQVKDFRLPKLPDYSSSDDDYYYYNSD